MTFKNSVSDYGSLSRFLHWTIALLVFVMFSTGISLNIVTTGVKTILLQIHIGCGLLTFAIVIPGIIWSFIGSKPDPPSMLKSTRLFTFKAIHLALYPGILILTISGIGILITSELGWPLTDISPDMISRNLPPVTVHGVMFKIQFILVMLHIGGVFSYQLFKEDVLHRMGINWLNRKK